MITRLALKDLLDRMACAIARWWYQPSVWRQWEINTEYTADRIVWSQRAQDSSAPCLDPKTAMERLRCARIVQALVDTAVECREPVLEAAARRTLRFIMEGGAAK